MAGTGTLVANDLKDLRNSVEKALGNSNFDLALGYVLQTVQHACTVAVERRLVCQGSPELDRICADIGRRFRLGGMPTETTVSVQESLALPTDLYIASVLYRDGGHTPLIGDYIRANNDRRSIILVTDIANTQDSIPEPILDRLFVGLDRVHVCNESGLVSKLKWLTGWIDALMPERVLLFNHMHDCVAASSVDPERDLRWWFVHHSDRLPCLGTFNSDLSHVDLTTFCFTYCRTKGVMGDHRYVPLTALDQGSRDFSHRRKGQVLTTASSGAAHKFCLDYRPSYVEVIARLLARTGGRHVHIGPLDHSYMRRFDEQLEARRVPKERLVHVPYVPSVWKAMAEYDVDLVLGSFPIPGAKTSVEVMGSGTPMVWHHSSDLSAFQQETSMRYSEAVVWRDPAELEDLVSRIDRNWLISQSTHARAHFDRAHSPNLTRQCLDGDCSTLVPHYLSEDLAQPRNNVEFDELLSGS